MAEESRAAADQSYNQKIGLNTEQYVALRALEMQREVCAKGGCTFLFSLLRVTPVCPICILAQAAGITSIGAS